MVELFEFIIGGICDLQNFLISVLFRDQLLFLIIMILECEYFGLVFVRLNELNYSWIFFSFLVLIVQVQLIVYGRLYGRG